MVLAKGDDQDVKLVAYIICCSDNVFDQASIRAYLKDQLPDYMIPSFFVPMDTLPLNSNGKIDRKAPYLEGGVIRDNEYVAPLNEYERILRIFSNYIKS